MLLLGSWTQFQHTSWAWGVSRRSQDTGPSLGSSRYLRIQPQSDAVYPQASLDPQAEDGCCSTAFLPQLRRRGRLRLVPQVGGASGHLQPRMPLARPGCLLCLWPTVSKSEGPAESSSGFNNLLEWLTELREAFYLQRWVTKEREKKVKAKLLSRVRLFVTRGSSIRGIFQAGVLEWVAISFSILPATLGCQRLPARYKTL